MKTALTRTVLQDPIIQKKEEQILDLKIHRDTLVKLYGDYNKTLNQFDAASGVNKPGSDLVDSLIYGLCAIEKEIAYHRGIIACGGDTK